MLHCLVAAVTALASASPEDLENIAVAKAIVERVGDSWPGWSAAPFRIDLLTASGPAEVGFTHPVPAPSFPPNLEATFPWQDGIPTIVIGEPQFTAAKTPTRWTVTLLHEHFHQWQNAWPLYFASTAQLGLSSPGDNGMWMLNYPFPYDDAPVDHAYAALAGRLADAIATPGPANDEAFLHDLTAFSNALGERDRRYFAFQCWQEGVARYTEYAVALAAAAAHAHDTSFLTSAQADLLAADAAHTYALVMATLRDPASLARDHRVAFYAFGAGEALLLDRMDPHWHHAYLDPKMDLSIFFTPAP